MPVQTESVTLAATTFQVAWERAELGEMPIALYVPPAGFQEWERAEVVDNAMTELGRQRLARYGQLTDEFTGMLTILARSRREVNLRLSTGKAGAPGSGLRAMAAAGNEDNGVLGSLADDKVTLRRVYGSGLAREIVGLLPELDAGPGRSVAVARALVDKAAAAAGGSLYDFAENLIRRGVPGDQARMIPRMVEGMFRRGQFGAAVRNRDGRRTATKTALAFHDTKDGGRYLMADRRTADGQVWTTITPASPALLAEHLQAMLDRLRAK